SKQDVNTLSSDKLIENVNKQELAYMYLNKADLSFAHFSFLSKYLVKNNTDIDDAFSFTDISLDLYDRCNSLSCFRKFNEAEKSMKVDRKSTRLNSSHVKISYAVFCL